jgi:hypothetical protein
MLNLAIKMLNLAIKMLNLAMKMLNLAIKMVNLVIKMLNLALKKIFEILSGQLNYYSAKNSVLNFIRYSDDSDPILNLVINSAFSTATSGFLQRSTVKI